MAKTIKTIDDLRAVCRKAQESKEGLKKEIEGLVKQQKDLEAKAEAAAAAGRKEEYISLREQAARAAAEAYVTSKQLEGADAPVSEEEAKAAWNAYITPANKAFEEKYAALMQTPQDMTEALLDLVKCLEESYSIRKECAKAAGIPITDSGPSYNSTCFPMKDVPAHSLDKYFNTLIQFGTLTASESMAHSMRVNTKL